MLERFERVRNRCSITFVGRRLAWGEPTKIRVIDRVQPDHDVDVALAVDVGVVAVGALQEDFEALREIYESGEIKDESKPMEAAEARECYEGT